MGIFIKISEILIVCSNMPEGKIFLKHILAYGIPVKSRDHQGERVNPTYRPSYEGNPS